MAIHEIINMPPLDLLNTYVLQGRDCLLYVVFASCKRLDNGGLLKIGPHKFLRTVPPEDNEAEELIQITKLEDVCGVATEEHYLAKKLINELKWKQMLLRRILTSYDKLLKKN